LKIAPTKPDGSTLISALAKASFHPVFSKIELNFNLFKIPATNLPTQIAIIQPIMKIIIAPIKSGRKSNTLSQASYSACVVICDQSCVIFFNHFFFAYQIVR
jgi:hypothetical protein